MSCSSPPTDRFGTTSSSGEPGPTSATPPGSAASGSRCLSIPQPDTHRIECQSAKVERRGCPHRANPRYEFGPPGHSSASSGASSPRPGVVARVGEGRPRGRPVARRLAPRHLPPICALAYQTPWPASREVVAAPGCSPTRGARVGRSSSPARRPPVRVRRPRPPGSSSPVRRPTRFEFAGQAPTSSGSPARRPPGCPSGATERDSRDGDPWPITRRAGMSGTNAQSEHATRPPWW
jgi:hypothetical protein